MVQTGTKGIRAIFADARDTLDRRQPALDPPPEIERDGIRAGLWPGAPVERMPPDCPVIPLGIDGKRSWFVDSAGQLIGVDASEWGKKILTQLFALRPNYLYWAWPRWSQPSKSRPAMINGLEVDDAHACLIKAASERGLFDATESVRGRGGWCDKAGRFIWHSGDRLLTVEGKRLRAAPTGTVDGVFYPRRPAVLEPWQEPVGPDDSPVHQLLGAFRTWSWERPALDPVLLIGQIGAGFLGGALPWRPTLFATGDKGVGKSRLQGIIKELYGNAVHASADTTAAGIYQRVRQDSLPVAVDELEADPDSRKTRGVIELARLAASGAMMFRGGAEHEGVQFRAINCFFFSSINMPPVRPQDRSRMAILNLARLDPARMSADAFGALDFAVVGRMLLRALMDAWPRFQGTFDDWRAVLRTAGLDGRAQDTYGVLLAVADLLLGHEAMEAAGLPVTDAGRLGRAIADATADERAEQEDNWRACLEHMLSSTIDAWKGGEKPIVGLVLHQLEAGVMEPGQARAQLGAAGLGIVERDGRWQLAVPQKGPLLERLLAGQVWAGGVWTGALRQGPPDVVLRSEGPAAVVKINRVACRCLLVDLVAFDRLVSGG